MERKACICSVLASVRRSSAWSTPRAPRCPLSRATRMSTVSPGRKPHSLLLSSRSRGNSATQYSDCDDALLGGTCSSPFRDIQGSTAEVARRVSASHDNSSPTVAFALSTAAAACSEQGWPPMRHSRAALPLASRRAPNISTRLPPIDRKAASDADHEAAESRPNIQVPSTMESALIGEIG